MMPTSWWDLCKNVALYLIVLPIFLMQLKRGIRQILDFRFYTKQDKEANIYVCPWMFPGLGSLFAMVWEDIQARRRGCMKHPITILMEKHCPMTPCNFLMGSCDDPGIIIGDVKVV